jgi:hypothetical protein
MEDQDSSLVNENQDMYDMFLALHGWIKSTSVRVMAMESIISSRLAITEDQWAEALRKAIAEFPEVQPQLEGFPALTDLLERAIGRKGPAES